MSEKYWIPDPYLVKLITLRGQYEDLSGSLTDFDHAYQSSHTLTPPQDSLIRWIFQETYSLWYDHVPVEKIWAELSDLVEAIPEFSEWEREQTGSLVLQMVSVLPRRESGAEKCRVCGNLVVTERCYECEKLGALFKLLGIRGGKMGKKKGTFVEFPDDIEEETTDGVDYEEETDGDFYDDEVDSEDTFVESHETLSDTSEDEKNEPQIPEIIVTFVE